MSTARFLVGDVFERMAELEDGSVDLIFTSPPFLALRSYLPADHPDKAKEIGNEECPAAFVDTLMRLTVEWRRLLAPHGSLVVELGDTFSGSGGGGGDYSADGLREGQPKFDGSGKRIRETRREGYIVNGVKPPARRTITDAWPMSKSLCLIPELYRIALVYGFNPLNPEHRIEPWRARNVIRWVRPNPPVGSLGKRNPETGTGDAKFRPATSELVVACVSGSRYFDLDAVREPSDRAHGGGMTGFPDRDRVGDNRVMRPNTITANPAGAPPLDWWEIPTHGYPGAHYATFPPALCVKPIKAMCPEKVCRTCGKPSERIVGYTDEYAAHRLGSSEANTDLRARRNTEGHRVTGRGSERMGAEHLTLGWTDCGHDDYRPGLVLDPFGGSGTTGLVATGHGRDAVLIDLDERNVDLARERIGMFLEVGPDKHKEPA